MYMRHAGAAAVMALLLVWGGPAQGAAQQTAEATPAATETAKDAAATAPHQMEDVVVTATRTEVEADMAPASVSIITHDDMERQNMRTADDALEHEAGVYTRRSRGVQDPSASSTVTMRGLSLAKRTLILVDGIPFNEGYSGGVTWSSIPVDAIERIEIIRGPGSALYGGNAMGGVINIILRVPKKTQAMVRGGIGGGNYNAHGGSAAFTNYKWGSNAGTRLDDQISLYAGYEGESTSGYPSSPVVKSGTSKGTGKLFGGYPTLGSTGTPSWIVGDSGNNMGQRQAASALAAWDLSDTSRVRADVIYGYHFYDYGSPNSYVGSYSGTVSTYPGSRTGSLAAGNFLSGKGETQDLRLSLSYDGMPTDWWRIKTTAAFFNEFNRYTQPTSSTTLVYDNAPGSLASSVRNSYFLELQNDFTLWPDNTLTFGGDLRVNSLDLSTKNLLYYRSWYSTTDKLDESSGMTNTWSAFLQDAWKLPANVTLYGGARLDYWVTYDGRSGNVGAVRSIPSSRWTEVSPRFAAVWNPLQDSVLRASASKGFRAPNLYEMLRSWTSAGTSPITYLPNANLKPETLWTYELSATQYFWKRRVKLGAAVFHTDFRNYIDSVYIAPQVKQQQNIGRLEINGLELEGQFKPWDFLTLWGNLTFNDPRIRKYQPDPSLNGKHLSGVPLTQANLGTDITWKQFKASLAGNYCGRNYARNDNTDMENVYGGNTQVWLWDAKLIYSPTKYTDISFAVQNLFDQQYYSYYAGSPRTYMLELKLKY